MDKLNRLGIVLGQDIYVTVNDFNKEYTPNVHKERVTSITGNSFYTASNFDKHHYHKQFNLVTGVADVGKRHYKAFKTEEDYLSFINK